MIALLRASTILLPWSIRRRVLIAAFGYDLHETSFIGFSWIFPRRGCSSGRTRALATETYATGSTTCVLRATASSAL